MEHLVNPDFHGTDDQLEAYALGRLAASDQSGLEVLEEHLMICSTCRDRLDGVEAFISGMKDAFGQHPAIAVSKQIRAVCLATPAQGFASDGFACTRRSYFHVFAGADSISPRWRTCNSVQSRGEMPVTGPAHELDLHSPSTPPSRGRASVP